MKQDTIPVVSDSRILIFIDIGIKISILFPDEVTNSVNRIGVGKNKMKLFLYPLFKRF